MPFLRNSKLIARSFLQIFRSYGANFMIENRSEEFQEIESKAMRLLENPNRLPKDAILKCYKQILRLWIYPSFSPYKVWIFNEPDFRTIKPNNIIIRQVIWDRNTDYQRLSNPLEGLKKGFHIEPNLEIKSVEIKKECFDEIFEELKQIQFPAFANYGKTIGIDGISCGIETFDFTHTTNISWWSVYPKEWQNLVEWFEKTTDFLEDKFSNINESF